MNDPKNRLNNDPMTILDQPDRSCRACKNGGLTITSIIRVRRISGACFPKYLPDWKLSHVSI